MCHFGHSLVRIRLYLLGPKFCPDQVHQQNDNSLVRFFRICACGKRETGEPAKKKTLTIQVDTGIYLQERGSCDDADWQCGMPERVLVAVVVVTLSRTSSHQTVAMSRAVPRNALKTSLYSNVVVR